MQAQAHGCSGTKGMQPWHPDPPLLVGSCPSHVMFWERLQVIAVVKFALP